MLVGFFSVVLTFAVLQHARTAGSEWRAAQPAAAAPEPLVHHPPPPAPIAVGPVMRFFPDVDNETRAWLAGSAPKVPQLLHQSWRSRRVPKQMHECLASWRRLQPTWRTLFHSDVDNQVTCSSRDACMGACVLARKVSRPRELTPIRTFGHCG